jgi:hypothetical protein
MKRYKMSKGKSKKHFTRGAMHVKHQNHSSPMRGGIRL